MKDLTTDNDLKQTFSDIVSSTKNHTVAITLLMEYEKAATMLAREMKDRKDWRYNQQWENVVAISKTVKMLKEKKYCGDLDLARFPLSSKEAKQ